MPNEASPRQTLMAFLLFAVVVAVGIAVVMAARPQPVQITILPPEPTPTPAPSATPAPITVYVTGAVVNAEQLISLPYGSRVEQAIERAGGLSDNADAARVNLAAILRDGDQVHVPIRNEILQSQPAGSEPALPTPQGGFLVNVNTATLEELMTLPSIGRVTAQAIIDYREANGAFRSLDDLDKVSGIGTTTLQRIAPLITFGD
jgi:competence protein ComEA